MKLLSFREAEHVNLDYIPDQDLFINIGRCQNSMVFYGGHHTKVIFLAFCPNQVYANFTIYVKSDTYVKLYFKISKTVSLNIIEDNPEISVCTINPPTLPIMHDYLNIKLAGMSSRLKILYMNNSKRHSKFVINSPELENAGKLIIYNYDGNHHKEYTFVIFNTMSMSVIFDGFAKDTTINLYSAICCSLYVPPAITVNYFSVKKIGYNNNKLKCVTTDLFNY